MKHTNVSDLFFSLVVKNQDGSVNLLSSLPKKLDLNKFDENNKLKCSIEIDSDFFRTGLFPLYFWLGKVGGLLGDNYPYDVVDSMSFLNFSSNKSKLELGYDSQNPGSPFNLKYNLIYGK